MYLGIDIGSVSTNVVIINDDNLILSYSIVKSGFDHKKAVKEATIAACEKIHIDSSSIKCIVSTGYGRKNVQNANRNITEISCHAKGANALFKNVKTIIDIGGQDSKVIRLTSDGFVESFAMNDKCAAGTGRFLEVMAHAMDISINSFGELSLKSNIKVPISSTCTVFAESEIISKIAEGHDRTDIIAGIHNAIADRILGLASSVGINFPIGLTGGVAKNKGVVKAICDRIENEVLIPDEPQIIGAYGAAIFAKDIVVGQDQVHVENKV